MLVIRCVFLTLLLKGAVGAVSIGQIATGIKTAAQMLKFTYKLFTDFDASVQSYISFETKEREEPQLFAQIQDVQNKLDDISTKIEYVGTYVVTVLKDQMAEEIKLQRRLDEIMDLMARIESLHRYMSYYLNGSKIENYTLNDFAANTVTLRFGTVQNILEMIQYLVGPRHVGVVDYGMFGLLARPFQNLDYSVMCKTQLSPQLLFQQVCNTILVTYIKGYTMLEISYIMSSMREKANYTSELQLMRQRHLERSIELQKSARGSMQNLDREFRRCEPARHIEGDTYVKITGLFQGYIVNEINLLSYDNHCSYSCDFFSNTKIYRDYDNNPLNNRPCIGNIFSCKTNGVSYTVCPSSDPGRQYDYVQYDSGVYGQKQVCERSTLTVELFRRVSHVRCFYCFCLCDDYGLHSDRYFNMRPVVADIANNKVVTGLRFTKKNRLIYLQIEEGTLLPDGEIDEDSVLWAPVENYNISDSSIQDGVDYYNFTSTHRTIALDDLITDNGHLITGVRFKPIGNHLALEVHVSRFNAKKGVLLDPFNTSVWINNNQTERTQVVIRKKHIPILDNTFSVLDSLPGQYVEFTNSDIDSDASQSTIPFLDAQPVAARIKAPLVGAGLYHKGGANSGGFVAAKITTYDLSKF